MQSTTPLEECAGSSGSGRTRLDPAFRWWVDRSGDGGRNPRNAPACKNEKNVVRGRGASKSCRTNSKDDSPHKKAGDGIRPVVPVLLHVVLPTLPADAARLRRAAHTSGPGGSSQGNSCHPASTTVHPLVSTRSDCPIPPVRRDSVLASPVAPTTFS